MTDDRRRSPLAHRSRLAGTRGIDEIVEISFRGAVQLRGAADIVSAPAATALGMDLPQAVGETTRNGNSTALWLAPDEWIILTAPGDEADTLSRLSDALSGVHHQAVDVSDYYTTVRVSGAAARELLAKLTHFDLHARAFPAGMGVATTLAKSNVWMVCAGADARGGATFDLVVRRSYADYVWCLLAEAGREWGITPQEPIGQVKLHLPHFEPA